MVAIGWKRDSGKQAEFGEQLYLLVFATFFTLAKRMTEMRSEFFGRNRGFFILNIPLVFKP
jgi:hypothetical protein